MYLPLSICLSAGQLKKLSTNYDLVLRMAGSVTNTKRSDFGPIGIAMNIQEHLQGISAILGWGIVQILLVTQDGVNG